MIAVQNSFRLAKGPWRGSAVHAVTSAGAAS
jgi:hypothetical protein